MVSHFILISEVPVCRVAADVHSLTLTAYKVTFDIKLTLIIFQAYWIVSFGCLKVMFFPYLSFAWAKIGENTTWFDKL